MVGFNNVFHCHNYKSKDDNFIKALLEQGWIEVKKESFFCLSSLNCHFPVLFFLGGGDLVSFLVIAFGVCANDMDMKRSKKRSIWTMSITNDNVIDAFFYSIS